MNQYQVTWEQFYSELLPKLAEKITETVSRPWPLPAKIYGIPRGGTYVAMGLHQYPNGYFEIVENPEDAEVFVDDLIDSGQTRDQYQKYGKPFLALFDKTGEDRHLPWIVFPWEDGQKADAERSILRFMQAMNFEMTEDRVDTPKRVVKFWYEFLEVPYPEFTVFPNPTNEPGADAQPLPIIQNGIKFTSICEHHLLPFFGEAKVAYIPDRTIVGLSKIARTVKWAAANIQTQERMTKAILDTLVKELQTDDVAVAISAEHTCMTIRGVKAPGTRTITQLTSGKFSVDPDSRTYFFNSPIQ